MPDKQLVWFILIIRVTASLTLVLIWIIRSPYRFAGRGGFTFHRTGKDAERFA
jgi:hypothetical protein